MKLFFWRKKTFREKLKASKLTLTLDNEDFRTSLQVPIDQVRKKKWPFVRVPRENIFHLEHGNPGRKQEVDEFHNWLDDNDCAFTTDDVVFHDGQWRSAPRMNFGRNNELFVICPDYETQVRCALRWG